MQDEIESTFLELGRQVTIEWCQRGDRNADFPELCFDILQSCNFHEKFDHCDILHWLARTETIPEQARGDETFGQPSLTLYCTDRFRIEALFWHTGTTAIHQHGFSGAFSVLEGSSLHSTYGFRPAHTQFCTSEFKFGAVELQSSELLRRGDVRRIDGGPALIHSLFHLDNPSVTIVIRTIAEHELGPEYVYLVPCLALDPMKIDMLMKKRLQALDLLLRADSQQTGRIATAMVSAASLHTAFHVLLKLRLYGRNSTLYDTILKSFRSRYTSVAENIEAAIEEECRREIIVRARRSITDPYERFLLALLLNLPNRQVILNFVRQRLECADPSEQVTEWIRSIGVKIRMGVDWDASMIQLLRWVLDGLTLSEIMKKVVQLTESKDRDAETSKAVSALMTMASNPILRPLFR